MATVLVANTRGNERATDQFLDALVENADSLQRDGKTLQVNLRGGGQNANIYGLAIEYPQTDIGLSLLDSDSNGLTAITTAVNAARPTLYVTQGLPQDLKGRWVEADTIIEGYTTDETRSGRYSAAQTFTRSVFAESAGRYINPRFDVEGIPPEARREAMTAIEEQILPVTGVSNGEMFAEVVFKGDPQGVGAEFVTVREKGPSDF